MAGTPEFHNPVGSQTGLSFATVSESPVLFFSICQVAVMFSQYDDSCFRFYDIFRTVILIHQFHLFAKCCCLCTFRSLP